MNQRDMWVWCEQSLCVNTHGIFDIFCVQTRGIVLAGQFSFAEWIFVSVPLFEAVWSLLNHVLFCNCWE